MNKESLEALITKLVALGEDKEELEFWLSIFDDLSEEKQQELVSNLEDELAELSAA